MRKLFALVGLGFLLTACPKPDGNLTGVLNRPVYVPELPMGMAYIPAGGFNQGENDQDVAFLHQTRSRSVSVQAFYMDETEISNNEYRQFVHWVRDSLAKELLLRNWLKTDEGVNSWTKGERNEEWEIEDSYRWLDYQDIFFNEWGIMKIGAEAPSDVTKSNDPKRKYKEFVPDDPDSSWNVDDLKQYFSLNWNDQVDYSNPDYVPTLADLYLPKEERFYKKRELDTRKLWFHYWWFDYRTAAIRSNNSQAPVINLEQGAYMKKGGQFSNEHDPTNEHRKLDPSVFDQDPVTGNNQGFQADKEELDPTDPVRALGRVEDTFVGGGQDMDLGWLNKKGQNNAIRGHFDRSRFIIEEYIQVYPDTLCWVRDFTYSFHDPMANMYFWHPAYDHYPVVGVTWVQAKAFSVWRTQLMNNWRLAMDELFIQDFRLPTEAEWERAARGDLENSQYPWGGPYIRNSSGCFLGNFKPMRGRYFEDGGFHTVKVYSYSPNNFGLYCMAGNVAEWCETAYDDAMYEFSHDLNPEFRYDALDTDVEALKRKVIRGGSWKDVGYDLMNATRNYEYQDTAKCYIGFRNVVTHMGRGGKDVTSVGETSEEPRSDIQLR